MPRAQAEGIQNRPARKGERPLVAATGAAALVGVAGMRAAAVTLLVVVVGAAVSEAGSGCAAAAACLAAGAASGSGASGSVPSRSTHCTPTFIACQISLCCRDNAIDSVVFNLKRAKRQVPQSSGPRPLFPFRSDSSFCACPSEQTRRKCTFYAPAHCSPVLQEKDGRRRRAGPL